MAEVNITGLADLNKALQELPGKIEANIMRGALRAGQSVIMREVKSRVPTDSGDLKNSVKIRFKGKSMRHGWLRMHLSAGDKKAFYAHMIEFGTGSYYEGSGRTVGGPYKIKPKKGKAINAGGAIRPEITHPGIKPQPFMRPGFDAANANAVQAVADYIKKRLPKEVAKHGRANNSQPT